MRNAREISSVDELSNSEFQDAINLMRKRGTLSPADAVELSSAELLIEANSISKFNEEFRKQAGTLLR